jgi:hypothetical protein
LSEQEYQQLKAALETLVYLTQLVEDKNTTIGRLRQILFGASSEKMSQVLETLVAQRASSDGGGKSEEKEKTSPQSPESAPSPGHGRNGVEAYSGARKVKIERSSLKSGNHCPGCQKGKLYALAPGVLIRVVGQAPLALHNDDTKMTILALMGESRPRQPSVEEELEEASERTGIFTSGIVSTRAGQKIALFFTGRKHAGENLATVLAERAEELGPPIQMCLLGPAARETS